jgi:hypothetical protein
MTQPKVRIHDPIGRKYNFVFFFCSWIDSYFVD